MGIKIRYRFCFLFLGGVLFIGPSPDIVPCVAGGGAIPVTEAVTQGEAARARDSGILSAGREAESARFASEPESSRSGIGARTGQSSDSFGDAALSAILEKTALYCYRLEKASLNFVCLEEVRETFYREIREIQFPGGQSGGVGFKGSDLRFKWIYDYQLIRQDGGIKESRTQLKKNGKKAEQKDAELETHRFVHWALVLGPIKLLGESAQAHHSYSFVKEGTVFGEPAVLIDIRPKDESASGNHGAAWIQKSDGAVLKIEWEPTSLRNYAIIEKFSSKKGTPAKLTLSTEFSFEKNGLRFPNKHTAEEAYDGLKTSEGNVFSETTVSYRNYKFFLVETSVETR